MANSKLEIDLSLKTALKIFLFIALGYVLYLLVPFFILFLLSCLLAITLEPFVRFLERYHFKRGISALIITLLFLGWVTLFAVFILPILFDQLRFLFNDWPTYREKLEKSIPFGGFVHNGLEHLSSPALFKSLGGDMGKLLAVGQVTVGALTGFLFMVVLAIYLLLDGRGAYRWLLHFFSESTKKKIEASSSEFSRLVSAYVAGQAITSLLAAIYAFSVLKIFDIPAALTLAFIAAIFDVLPILGFFIFTIPAVILAFSVSPFAAMMVLILYTLYHLFENYFIVPRVYGNRLRLSDLTVLLSVTIATIIAGIPGAIAVLPLVAAYPKIEKIWLKDILPSSSSSKSARES